MRNGPGPFQPPMAWVDASGGSPVNQRALEHEAARHFAGRVLCAPTVPEGHDGVDGGRRVIHGQVQAGQPPAAGSRAGGQNGKAAPRCEQAGHEASVPGAHAPAAQQLLQTRGADGDRLAALVHWQREGAGEGGAGPY